MSLAAAAAPLWAAALAAVGWCCRIFELCARSPGRFFVPLAAALRPPALAPLEAVLLPLVLAPLWAGLLPLVLAPLWAGLLPLVLAPLALTPLGAALRLSTRSPLAAASLRLALRFLPTVGTVSQPRRRSSLAAASLAAGLKSSGLPSMASMRKLTRSLPSPVLVRTNLASRVTYLRLWRPTIAPLLYALPPPGRGV